MSNATYNGLWSEAISELTEQVHLEDPSLMDDGEAPEPHRPTSIVQTFQHLACLYIKYLQIFKRLETCYDCMVHPQKRADVLKVLELVMRRVIELKHALVKYNPPPPPVHRGPGKPEKLFPWEYVNLDDILVDLKLPPETLEVPVPKYFKENSLAARRVRDKIVTGYTKVRHGVEKIMVEDDENGEPAVKMEMAQSIEIIQRNERGRQGKQRALLVKELREEEKRRRNYDAAAQLEMDPEIAAIGIQRLFRGFFSRARAAVAREEELVFIGMRPPKKKKFYTTPAAVATTSDQQQKGQKQLPPKKESSSSSEYYDLGAALAVAYRKRKQEQIENQAAYEKALGDLKEVVKEEEGPHMRAELRGERTDWVTHVIETTKQIPEDLSGFYPAKYPEQAEAKDEAKDAADSKDDKKKKKKEPKEKKKDKKGKKGKKGKAKVEDDKPLELPLLQGKSELTTAMHAEIKVYEGDWADRDERENFAQKHDVELAKRSIRDDVRIEIRDQVDEMLKMSLKKIKLQLNKGSGGGKKDKKKKEKKKGKKGKKDKKGGKKKALPGDKIADLKNASVEETLALLIEAKVVNSFRDRKVADLVGDFNYLGTVQQHTESHQTAWQPPTPSMAQLRAAVAEYCVLRLGSANVKAQIQDAHNVKSILFYGPEGSGKTMMAEAVANELGALVINISPPRLRAQFAGKTGPTKLCHMIYTLAKDDAFAPVVVYMDQCEQFFLSGGGGGKKSNAKNVDRDGPIRFKKDLLTYKNAFAKEDRILFIGTTSAPDKADNKDLKSFFDKMLYFPHPDYPSRLMLWRECITTQLRLGGLSSGGDNTADDFDLSTLAQISEGFSGGAICQTVKKTLTARRVHRLDKRPQSETEFLNALAQAAAKSNLNIHARTDDAQIYNDFTSKITGLDDERKRVAAEKADGGGAKSDGDDKKKKGKKGKKGKKKK